MQKAHQQKSVEDKDQNNFEFLLSMGEEELKLWLADLPEEYLTYVEWLLTRVEFQLDKFLMVRSQYNEANEVIKRIKDGI